MKILLVSLLSLLILFSCKAAQKTIVPAGDNSRNSVDWTGTYTGTLPCADCEGIQQTITLNRNLTYTLSSQYNGKPGKPVNTTGKFTWNKEGSIISLDGKFFQVGENKLFQLDINGKRITGDLASQYELLKVNTGILNKYWKLTEMAVLARFRVVYF